MIARIVSVCICFSVCSLPAVGREIMANDWKLLHRYELGGEGGWDYLTLDQEDKRLYVTRGDHLMVVDADSGKLLADIDGLKHSHGVALVKSVERGYVSNGHGDSVTIVDLKNLKAQGEITVTGTDPDAILFDPSSNLVLTFNAHSNNVSFIDPTSNRVVATMAVPGQPEFAVSDAKGRVYFNLEDKSAVAVADVKAIKVTDTWSLGTCEGPTGLAIDPIHGRLFSVCANKQMIVLDSRNGKVVATLPIGEGPDAAAYDAGTHTVYGSNSDGTLTVIHQDDADHYRVTANVQTPRRSKTMALDSKMHRVFLGAAEFGPTPPPTKDEPHPRPSMKAGSFAIVVYGTE